MCTLKEMTILYFIVTKDELVQGYRSYATKAKQFSDSLNFYVHADARKMYTSDVR